MSRIANGDGTFDVLRIRCHPVLEELMRQRFRSREWQFDSTMGTDRVEVTPFAYVENIQCEIGFSGPKLDGDS